MTFGIVGCTVVHALCYEQNSQKPVQMCMSPDCSHPFGSSFIHVGLCCFKDIMLVEMEQSRR